MRLPKGSIQLEHERKLRRERQERWREKDKADGNSQVSMRVPTRHLPLVKEFGRRLLAGDGPKDALVAALGAVAKRKKATAQDK